jgi:hypothetical protein
MGFTFDDSDPTGVASPVSDMTKLTTKDVRNAERIFPYIGGDEVNSSPRHSPHRWVINFETMTEKEARKWPDLMAILETKVKPERMKVKRERHRKLWWLYGDYRQGLHSAIASLPRVLVCSQVSSHLALAFLPTTYVYSHGLDIFALSTYSAFCTLQCRTHEIWGRFFGSSLEDRLRYTPSDCFETCPFPDNWETDPTLETAGGIYYEFRSALMIHNHEGLTKTYNRFHDPDELDMEIVKLRKLHDDIDRAVLDAYGWTDIKPSCGFFLDYEIDNEDDWGDKKKPWRYRWPDDARDEILARLMELNEQRAKAEARSGAAAQNNSKKTRIKRSATPAASEGLFS